MHYNEVQHGSCLRLNPTVDTRLLLCYLLSPSYRGGRLFR